MAVALGFLAFFFSHVVLWRRRPSNSPRIFLLAGLAGGGMVVSSFFYSLAASRFNGAVLCAILWTDLFFMIAYVFFYAGAARSVSVTLLTRILESGAPVKFQTLLEEYVSSGRFEDRIRLMETIGLMRTSGENVMLTPVGFSCARTLQKAARLLVAPLEG